ncbi:MAG: hypothetical protein IH600_08230 [Bacteroidetes bacterium]|nr:hypothetical protein [Bacteroidota bacterium]
MDQAGSGNVFFYGGGSSLGMIVRKAPGAEIICESVLLPTEVPVASLAEVGPNQYYLSCWWTNTGESHLWKWNKGEISPAEVGGETDTSEYWFQSLWSVDGRLFAIHNQELIVQEVKDQSNYVRYAIPRINSPQGVVRKFAGTTVNDVFFVGDNGRVFHFNGHSVNKYDEVGELCPTASLLDVTVTKNKVYVVGEDYRANRAVLLVGTRVNK